MTTKRTMNPLSRNRVPGTRRSLSVVALLAIIMVVGITGAFWDFNQTTVCAEHTMHTPPAVSEWSNDEVMQAYNMQNRSFRGER